MMLFALLLYSRCAGHHMNHTWSFSVWFLNTFLSCKSVEYLPGLPKYRTVVNANNIAKGLEEKKNTLGTESEVSFCCISQDYTQGFAFITPPQTLIC